MAGDPPRWPTCVATAASPVAWAPSIAVAIVVQALALAAAIAAGLDGRGWAPRPRRR